MAVKIIPRRYYFVNTVNELKENMQISWNSKVSTISEGLETIGFVKKKKKESQIPHWSTSV